MNPFLELLTKTLIKKKRQDPKNLLATIPDEDFIPYVCHYDPNTILTKNGELLQIIRITGLSSASMASEIISLREAVRDSLRKHVKETNFAFWFNTIRRKKNITPRGEFKEPFAKEVNEIWTEKNNLKDQYVNELYITVIIEGIDTSIINLKSFLRSFSYSSIKSLHRNFLQEAHEKLCDLSKKILHDVEDYGGKLLGIKDWEGVLYSEPMRFFSKIVNLYEGRYPLACNDISSEMSSHKIAFGDRELQVVGNNNKNSAAIFSIKEYFEVSTAALDKILQLPLEFIITQSFDFSFSKKELAPFEYQDYILKVSNDDFFRQVSGISDFVEEKKNLPTDYGKEQVTMMLIAKNHDDLEKETKMVFEQFNALGFVVVREDVFLEHCFWAQLPANFRFLKRQKVINSNQVAGFAALHDFPSGSIVGNHWGPAVCTLKTVLDTPYFFNFHEGNLGHSLIVGGVEDDYAGLLNFLLLQARKFDNKLFYFDFENGGEGLIKMLQGAYYNLSERDLNNQEFLHLNPLLLSNGKDKNDFLVSFFSSLVAFSKEKIPQNEIDFIPQIIDRITTANITDFTAACETFNCAETRKIYEKLQVWNQDSLKNIFSSNKQIDFSQKIIGFDFTEFFEQKPILIPIINYLTHLVLQQLDGKPAIIVINQAWDLFDNVFMSEKIINLLHVAKNKNAIIILTADNPKHLAVSELTPKIKQELTSEFFMPNQLATDDYKKAFALNDDELEIVKMMEKGEGHFLLRYGDDSLIIALGLEKLGQIARLLDPDQVSLTTLREVISANFPDGKVTDVQLLSSQVVEILQAIQDEEIAAEKERIKQEEIKSRAKMQG